MISRFKCFALVVLLFASASGSILGQQRPAEQKDEKKPAADEKKPAADEKKPAANSLTKEATKNFTAEQVAESVIIIYGLGGGRTVLNQIRKTALEKGRISVTGPEGKSDHATYQRWTQRAETLRKEKIRFEQTFPNVSYSLVFNEEKIFGVVDDQVFTPREDASRAFQNQIVHGLETLLRYKENESKIEMPPVKEKILGVEYFVVDVTDKESRRTKFYISAKTFRVMMLDYEQDGVKYRRKFYDYNYAQGTLFPFRTTLWAGDKLIEETEVGTITFGQKIDEALFAGG